MSVQTEPEQPVLFLSHGAPPLADDATWTGELADWSTRLTRLKQILIVSAHWEQAPLTLSATRPVPLVYDFWGFPERYYSVTYAAPPAAELADRVTAAIEGSRTGPVKGMTVRRNEERGLDHGAYVPLVEMFPDADVPVLQMSMPTLEPEGLVEVGRALAPLRSEGTLIIGSGFTTHNLGWFHPHDPADAPPPAASSEFDHWAAETMAAGDLDTLVNFANRAPAAAIAHPRTEHWAPLFVALGAAEGAVSTSVIDGFWFGLSKRSWQLN